MEDISQGDFFWQYISWNKVKDLLWIQGKGTIHWNKLNREGQAEGQECVQSKKRHWKYAHGTQDVREDKDISGNTTIKMNLFKAQHYIKKKWYVEFSRRRLKFNISLINTYSNEPYLSFATLDRQEDKTLPMEHTIDSKERTLAEKQKYRKEIKEDCTLEDWRQMREWGEGNIVAERVPTFWPDPHL